MHIVTGMLLAGLLGRKGAGRAAGVPLPVGPGLPRMVHALPGRSRFQVGPLLGRTEAARSLQETLGTIEGVGRACVDPRTGTVLVQHDPSRLTPAVLFAVLVRLLGLEKELEQSPESSVGRELQKFGRALDQATYGQTGGLLDLKTALFLLLAGVGAWKLYRQRSLALPAGFTLLWWAGNGLFRGRQLGS